MSYRFAFFCTWVEMELLRGKKAERVTSVISVLLSCSRLKSVSRWAEAGWCSTSPPGTPPSPGGWGCRCREWRGDSAPRPGRRRWGWEAAAGRWMPGWWTAGGQRSSLQRSAGEGQEGGRTHRKGASTFVVGFGTFICICDVIFLSFSVAPFPAPLTVTLHQALRTRCQSADGCASRLGRWVAAAKILQLPRAVPPSVCRLALTLATASASPNVTAIAKPTRHGASTAATREPHGARSVCGGTDHTGRQKMAPDDSRRPTRYNHHQKHAGNTVGADTEVLRKRSCFAWGLRKAL